MLSQESQQEQVPSPAIVIERQQLKDDIERLGRELESLRSQEFPLRGTLANAIDLHRFACERAAHCILTNQYRDGHANLDVSFDRVRDAETALIALIEDITRTETNLDDLRTTLNDAALWEAK